MSPESSVQPPALCDVVQRLLAEPQQFPVSNLHAIILRALAAIPTNKWSLGQRKAALEIARFYKEELGKAGINVGDLPEPRSADCSEAPVRRSLLSSGSGGTLNIQFEYQGGLVQEVKNRIPGLQFQKLGRRAWWTAPAYIDSIEACVKVATAKGFDFDEKVVGTCNEVQKAAEQIKREILKREANFLLTSPRYADLEKAGEFPGAKKAGPHSRMIAPFPNAVWALDSFAQRKEIVFDPEAAQYRDALLSSIKAKIAASRAAEADFAVPRLGIELRPYQRAGLRYLKEVADGRCLIGDDNGLGKSVEALAFIEAVTAYPAALVVQPDTVQHWTDRVKEVLPMRSVELAGRQVQDFTADLVILRYDYHLDVHIAKLRARGLQAVVFDESQAYLQNHKTVRMTNCRQLAEGIPVRLCLSGEMALQQPQALLSQLDLLDRLAGLGGFPAYTRRYCSAEWKEKKRVLGGASNLAELENALRATCLLCRRKRDVAGQLDPKPS